MTIAAITINTEASTFAPAAQVRFGKPRRFRPGSPPAPRARATTYAMSVVTVAYVTQLDWTKPDGMQLRMRPPITPAASEHAIMATNRAVPLARPGKIALARATPVRIKQRIVAVTFDISCGMDGSTDAQ